MRQLAPTQYALFSLALLLIAVLPMKAHRRVIQLPSFGPRKGKQINATPVFPSSSRAYTPTSRREATHWSYAFALGATTSPAREP